MTGPHIDIVWDPAKAQRSLSKQGVAFDEAAEVLLDPMALTVFDTVHSQVEVPEIDFSGGQRGKLHRQGAALWKSQLKSQGGYPTLAMMA